MGGAASFLAYFCPRDGVSNDTGQFVIPYRFSYNAQLLGDKPVDLSYANVLYNQAGEYFEKADYKKAAELYIEALEEHKENHHTDMDTLRIQCALGNAYKYSGEIDLAIDTYTEAIGTLKSTKELDNDWTEEKEREYYSELINVYYLRGTAHFEKNDLYLADEDRSNLSRAC